MSVGKKVIKIGLSEKDIDRAIRELADYKQEILKKTELLRERVAERLAEEAKSGFAGAVVDDLVKGGNRYAQVDVSIDNRGSVTVVVASGEDAVWVEFGAGVYHNGSPGSSPHPRGAELGMTIGGFGKGNGKKEIWGFYEEGELKLSRGTPAAMPMSRAITTVCNDISQIAKEVFG
jgi:hypothetical protein